MWLFSAFMCGSHIVCKYFYSCRHLQFLYANVSVDVQRSFWWTVNMHICYPLPDPICYPLAVYILRAQMRFEKGFLFKFELLYLTGLFSLGIFVRRSLSMGGCSLSRERGLCFSIILFLNHGLECSLGVFNLPLSNHCCLHPHWFWRTYQHSY